MRSTLRLPTSSSAPAERASSPRSRFCPCRISVATLPTTIFVMAVWRTLHSSLAGLHELLVISQRLDAGVSGAPPDPREVARALGVRYVLRGSMRRSERWCGSRWSCAMLKFGCRLWAEKAEVPPGRSVRHARPSRVAHRRRDRTERARGRVARRDEEEARSFTVVRLHAPRASRCRHALDMNTFRQARQFLESAMAEDPDFAMPVAWAARWHSLCLGQGWSTNPAQDRAQAVELAAKAIELDPQNALALATCGHLRSFLFHDYDSALIYFERALPACPNHSLAWMLSVLDAELRRADRAGHSARPAGAAALALRHQRFFLLL